MLVNSPTNGDLLTNLGTGRAGETQLRRISFDTQYLSTSSGRADVHHQHFVLRKLGNFGLYCSIHVNYLSPKALRGRVLLIPTNLLAIGSFHTK